MKKIRNKWMLATIIFVTLIVGILSFYVYEKNFATYDFNGVKLLKSDFNKLHDELPRGVYKICSTENSDCFSLYQDMLK